MSVMLPITNLQCGKMKALFGRHARLFPRRDPSQLEGTPGSHQQIPGEVPLPVLEFRPNCGGPFYCAQYEQKTYKEASYVQREV